MGYKYNNLISNLYFAYYCYNCLNAFCLLFLLHGLTVYNYSYIFFNFFDSPGYLVCLWLSDTDCFQCFALIIVYFFGSQGSAVCRLPRNLWLSDVYCLLCLNPTLIIYCSSSRVWNVVCRLSPNNTLVYNNYLITYSNHVNMRSGVCRLPSLSQLLRYLIDPNISFCTLTDLLVIFSCSYLTNAAAELVSNCVLYHAIPVDVHRLNTTGCVVCRLPPIAFVCYFEGVFCHICCACLHYDLLIDIVSTTTFIPFYFGGCVVDKFYVPLVQLFLLTIFSLV